MRLNILLFAGGVWLLQQQAQLPDTRTILLLAALVLAACLPGPSGTTARRAWRCIVLAACCAAGFAWAAMMAGMRLSDGLPAEWEGRDIRIEGVVAGLPQPYERGVRFEFDVERVLTAGAAVPGRIALTWWVSTARDESRTPPFQLTRPESGSNMTLPALSPGERWRLSVRLRRPHGVANPHGFDYEAWLMERNLRATGYVRSRSGSERLAPLVPRPQYWIERARERLRARILAALPDGQYAGVLVALAVGDQRAIPPEQWQVYTRTGVNHLMSISGLHVTMLSGLIFALVNGLWRRSPRLVIRLPAPKAAAGAGLATAFGYALLAGFAVPAQRTVYMLCVVAAAVWLGTIQSASQVLALALLVVLLLDPWAVLAPGFWLSFGAVAAIMFVCNGRVGNPGRLMTWARVQLAVTFAMVPALLAMFQQVSMVSPIANAIAIPAVGLGVVPLTLAGMLLPFDWVLRLSHLLMGWCMWFLDWLSSLDAAVWEQGAPPGWAVVLATCGALLLLAPRGLPGRWLGAVGLLPLVAVAPAAPVPGALRVSVLDVGQGVAAVVRTANHALLYDAGPAFGAQADSGSRVIVPFLRASGVKRLDSLVVSHDDADHWGGAASVLQALPVERLVTSLPELDPLLFQAAAAVRCRAGQHWEWDGVRFEMLHPPPSSYDVPGLRDNDRSCVLMVSAPGARIMFPGDIERRSELALAARYGTELGVDVLIAPHQGSKTSSTAEFLRAASPRIVVFPVGYRNRFGHPHQQVLRRYAALGTRLYRTDRDGAVTLEISPQGAITVTPHRSVYRRYWQTGLEGDPAPGREEFAPAARTRLMQ